MARAYDRKKLEPLLDMLEAARNRTTCLYLCYQQTNDPGDRAAWLDEDRNLCAARKAIYRYLDSLKQPKQD